MMRVSPTSNTNPPVQLAAMSAIFFFSSESSSISSSSSSSVVMVEKKQTVNKQTAAIARKYHDVFDLLVVVGKVVGEVLVTLLWKLTVTTDEGFTEDVCC